MSPGAVKKGQRLLNAAHAFLTQLLNGILSILNGLLCLGGLGFAFCYTSIPFCLLGQTTSLIVFFVMHGQFGLLELVLSRLHFYRCIFSSACAHGVIHGRLSHCVLL